MKPYTIVETFVGCGGAHLGFKKNGFKSLLVNDINKDMLDTLLLNNVTTKDKMYLGSIYDLRGKLLQKHVSEPVDVLFGGIVCKGFSLAGVRNPFDKRNYLYKEQLRLVEELRPKVSIIENVAGLKSMYLYRENDAIVEIMKKYETLLNKNKTLNGTKTASRKRGDKYNDIQSHIVSNQIQMKAILNSITDFKFKVFEEIKHQYDQLGYNVYSKVMDASLYGSFTRRKRLIIVAIRRDIKKTFYFPEQVKRVKTLQDALNLIQYDGNNHPDVDKENKAIKHKPTTVLRFHHIPEGKTLVDVMDEIPTKLRLSSRFSRGSASRLHRNKTVPTLVPGHCNFPIHPWEDRLITIREAATITGFPISYKFSGNLTSRYIQVGNAVPVHLADVLARSVRNLLSTT
tara:strand:+ start:1617 stop:2816 length:1200 start_codon:yes stop_codon:yes gene_type:complete